jgi:sugar phosphate isomerase/epimerase
MKLALMAGDMVPARELRSLGFEAIQVFFASGQSGQDGSRDPTPDDVDEALRAGGTALAAMALHVDLVGPQGRIPADVDRAVRCVAKTAELDGRFGANEKPVMIWHPSQYPADPGVDDSAVFQGLCEALGAICKAAEERDVHVAIEITRAGSIGSAETFVHIKDRVGSDALRVCMDAANFTPDRTPLERAVRMLGPDIVIAHGKDVRFSENGEVSAYGPVGSGTLDYPEYIRCLQEYARPSYLVLEYYRSRDDLLAARDIVLQSLSHR